MKNLFSATLEINQEIHHRLFEDEVASEHRPEEGVAQSDAENRRRFSFSKKPVPESSPEMQSSPADAELIVAVFRTVVLLVALFVPRLLHGPTTYETHEFWLAVAASAYNLVAILAYLSPGQFRLRRPLIILMDLLLITQWIRLSELWELFPLYYIVVVVAAMWYRVLGGVMIATFCNLLYGLLLWRAINSTNPGSLSHLTAPQIISTTFALNVALLFLIGALVGSIAQAQERDRLRILQNQLLIANYQREIDLAMQLQPLLISPQWLENGSGGTAQLVSLPLSPDNEHKTDAVSQRLDPTLQLSLAMQPARAFGGGDYFDLMPLEDGRTAICIADVSGKSVRAQARLPLLKYALRALVPLYPEPATLMERLNETLSPDLQGELFIGLCYVVLDPEYGSLTWCNAGHIAPILLPAQPIAEKGNLPKLFHSLETTGPALGPFPEIGYSSQTLPWNPGDRLLLFTDGLSDAFSRGGLEDGEEYTHRIALATSLELWQDPQLVARRFLELALTTLEETNQPREHLSPLRRRTEPVIGSGATRRDDITIVAVRHGGE